MAAIGYETMKTPGWVPRLLLGAAMGCVAMVMYHATQYLSAGRAVVRTDCWSWHWVPFHAAWCWPYQSLFVLMGLPWFLLPTMAEVKRFAVALLATAAVGWTVFLSYPTACVRPTEVGQPWYYATLHELDWPNNCLPCLHSALLVVTVWALLRRGVACKGAVGRAILLGWSAAILISIVALRQHTGTDILAGLALGGLGAWIFGGRAPAR